MNAERCATCRAYHAPSGAARGLCIVPHLMARTPRGAWTQPVTRDDMCELHSSIREGARHAKPRTYRTENPRKVRV